MFISQPINHFVSRSEQKGGDFTVYYLYIYILTGIFIEEEEEAEQVSIFISQPINHFASRHEQKNLKWPRNT